MPILLVVVAVCPHFLSPLFCCRCFGWCCHRCYSNSFRVSGVFFAFLSRPQFVPYCITLVRWTDSTQFLVIDFRKCLCAPPPPTAPDCSLIWPITHIYILRSSPEIRDPSKAHILYRNASSSSLNSRTSSSFSFFNYACGALDS